MYRILTIILVSVLLMSCNKATIDLVGFEPAEGNAVLLGKWRLVDWDIERITNNEDVTIDELPESEYKEDDILLDFSANGKVLMSYAYLDEDENGNEVKRYFEFEVGYKLSADKKTLTLQDEDGGTIYTINKLDAKSLVYRGKQNIEVCVGSNCQIVEEYWSTLYFTKVQ